MIIYSVVYSPKKYQLLELVDYLYRVMHRPFKPLSLPPPVFR